MLQVAYREEGSLVTFSRRMICVGALLSPAPPHGRPSVKMYPRDSARSLSAVPRAGDSVECDLQATFRQTQGCGASADRCLRGVRSRAQLACSLRKRHGFNAGRAALDARYADAWRHTLVEHLGQLPTEVSPNQPRLNLDGKTIPPVMNPRGQMTEDLPRRPIPQFPRLLRLLDPVERGCKVVELDVPYS